MQPDMKLFHGLLWSLFPHVHSIWAQSNNKHAAQHVWTLYLYHSVWLMWEEAAIWMVRFSGSLMHKGAGGFLSRMQGTHATRSFFWDAAGRWGNMRVLWGQEVWIKYQHRTPNKTSAEVLQMWLLISDFIFLSGLGVSDIYIYMYPLR